VIFNWTFFLSHCLLQQRIFGRYHRKVTRSAKCRPTKTSGEWKLEIYVQFRAQNGKNMKYTVGMYKVFLYILLFCLFFSQFFSLCSKCRIDGWYCCWMGFLLERWWRVQRMEYMLLFCVLLLLGYVQKKHGIEIWMKIGMVCICDALSVSLSICLSTTHWAESRFVLQSDRKKGTYFFCIIFSIKLQIVLLSDAAKNLKQRKVLSKTFTKFLINKILNFQIFVRN
jgi:hypothetical protein